MYKPIGLLADHDHLWKILHWIDVELKNGAEIEVVKT